MQSRFSDRQYENAFDSILTSADRRSNVTDRRDGQLSKQVRPRKPTEEGTAIDRSEPHEENADGPISQRWEPHSKTTI
jgi:hypothetical protein